MTLVEQISDRSDICRHFNSISIIIINVDRKIAEYCYQTLARNGYNIHDFSRDQIFLILSERLIIYPEMNRFIFRTGVQNKGNFYRVS